MKQNNGLMKRQMMVHFIVSEFLDSLDLYLEKNTLKEINLSYDLNLNLYLCRWLLMTTML